MRLPLFAPPLSARAGSPLAPGSARSAALIAAVVAASLALWIAKQDLALALAPLALTLFGWALIAAPPHRVALAIFFLGLVLDNPKENPAEGRWASPLQPLGVLLHENLNAITGIGPLRFAVIDLLILAMVVLSALRTPRPDAITAPRALHRVLLLAWLAVVWIEAWGLARGGNFRATLWQLRALFWVPALAFVLTAWMRGPRDLPAVGKAIVLAALIKAGIAVYFVEVVCRRTGVWPSYATTHSDTLLFVTALVAAAAFVLEAPRLRHAVLAALIVVPIALGVIFNGRRLAYIGVAAAAAGVYLVLPYGRLLRTMTRAAAVLAPLTTIYLALGWRSDAGVFGPARKVASLFAKDDRSAMMRDIENYNLILTWKQHLFFGSGFGHEYSELTRPEGATEFFPMYRYIAHNSVLWLEVVGGVVGFAAFWTLLTTLAYLAARSHRFATAPVDRAAALTALSVVSTFGIQAYGDMGLTSWTGMFLLAMALSMMAKLAVATGAFPSRPP